MAHDDGQKSNNNNDNDDDDENSSFPQHHQCKEDSTSSVVQVPVPLLVATNTNNQLNEVIVDCMTPYLKRSTWNQLSVTCSEMMTLLQTRLPPWPSSSPNGNSIQITTGNGAGILSLAISPHNGGEHLVAGCTDGYIRVYHRNQQNIGQILLGRSDRFRIEYVSFLPHKTTTTTTGTINHHSRRLRQSPTPIPSSSSSSSPPPSHSKTITMISADRGINIKVWELHTTTTSSSSNNNNMNHHLSTTSKRFSILIPPSTITFKHILGENLNWRHVQNSPSSSSPKWDISSDGQRLVVGYSIGGQSNPHSTTGCRTNISIWSIATGKCLKRWGLQGVPNGGFCGLSFSTCCYSTPAPTIRHTTTNYNNHKNNKHYHHHQQDYGIYLASCMNIKQEVSIWYVGDIINGDDDHDHDNNNNNHEDDNKDNDNSSLSPPPCIMTLTTPTIETPPTSSTTAIAWSPLTATTTTKYLACACWDGTVRLWSVPTDTYTSSITDPTSTNTNVTTAATSSSSTPCHIIRTLEAHNTTTPYRIQVIACIAFSPNGKILVSGGGNQCIQLWNVEDGSCLSTFYLLQGGGGGGTSPSRRRTTTTHHHTTTTTNNNNLMIRSILFAPRTTTHHHHHHHHHDDEHENGQEHEDCTDSRTIITGDSQGNIQFWDVPHQQ